MIRSCLLKTNLIVLIMVFNSFEVSSQKYLNEVGLQLWSVREDMAKDPIATLEKIGEMGYPFIEAAGYNEGKFYGIDPAEFKTVLNKNGLELISSHVGHPLPDTDNWDEAMLVWDKCIEAHIQAGAKYIIQPSMDEKGYGSLEDLKRYCEYFNVIGEKCRAKGIQFGYHNHDQEFAEVDNITRYDYMLQNTDPRKVIFELDVYWIKVGGKKALDYFAQYPGRFALWHLKDEKELGESGTMDFKSLFEKAKQAGLKNVIVEVENYNYSPLESVEKSLKYLKDLSY